MSSLQRQLAAIAANSSNEYDLTAQKKSHSKSLLFEPVIAGSQTLHDLYLLCVTGFEELCGLDDRFRQFGKTIFSAESIAQDRSQMNVQENEALDRVLVSFMGLVGSRLLLKPALRAMEWIIRRFRVHEYNVEKTVLTFLPYHATPVFVNLLSLLPKQLPVPVRFLHPYMYELTNPSRTAILQASLQSQGFSDLLTDHVLNMCTAGHEYNALISFWTGVTVQTIASRIDSSKSGRQNIQHRREDELLTEVLSVLQSALKIKSASDLLLGCYMIVVVIVAKLDLEDAALDALGLAVAESANEDIIEASLGCLATIYDHKSYVGVPAAIAEQIFTIDGLIQKLTHIGSDQDVSTLMLGLCQYALKRKASLPPDFTEKIFEQILGNELLAPSIRAEAAVYILKSFTLEGPLPNHVHDWSKLVEEATFVHRSCSGLNSWLPHNETGNLEIGTTSTHVNGVVDFETLKSNINDLRWTGSSLLDESNDAIYGLLVQYFALSTDSAEASFNDFLELLIFQKNEAWLSFIFTFFIRTWCTHAIAQIRASALVQATALVQTLAESNVDFSSLLPYVLTALNDEAKEVRNQAAILMRASRSLKPNQLPAAEIDVSSIPGSFEIETISDKVESAFVEDYLLPSLEECVIDREYVLKTLQSALKGSQVHVESVRRAETKHLKANERIELIKYLVSHTRGARIMSTKLVLLRAVNGLSKISGQRRSTYLISAIRDWATVDAKKVLGTPVDLLQLDVEFCNGLHPGDPEAMNLLVQLALGKVHDAREALQKAASNRLQDKWASISEDVCLAIADSLLTTAFSHEASLSKHVLRSFELMSDLQWTSSTLNNLLRKSLEAISDLDERSVKKLKTENGISWTQTKRLAKLAFVLEQTESSELHGDVEIFYTLFRTLQLVHHLSTDDTVNLDNMRTVILACLLRIVQEWEATDTELELDTSVVQIHMLVECIKRTSSNEARNTALLVMAYLARLLPLSTLDNVMEIFTFVATTTLRQNDEVSINIVDQTIQKIIPLLAQTLRQQNLDIVTNVSAILGSFAAAFDHIPSNRRLRLYTTLANALGIRTSLYAIIVTLIDHFPGSVEVYRFASSLLRQVEVNDVFFTLIKFVQIVSQVPDDGTLRYKSLLRDDLTVQQQEEHREAFASALMVMFSNGINSIHVSRSLNRSKDSREELLQFFGELISQILSLTQSDQSSETLQSHSSKALQQLLMLLPFEWFVKSIEPLLSSAPPNLLQRLLKTLESQVRPIQVGDSHSSGAALEILPKLTSILENNDNPAILANTIACISQIFDKSGKMGSLPVQEASKSLISSGCATSEDRLICMLSLYMLASSVEMLRNEFTPMFPASCDAAYLAMCKSLASADPDTKLFKAACAFLSAVIDTLPYLMIADTLIRIVELIQKSASVNMGEDADAGRMQLFESMTMRLDIKIVADIVQKSFVNAIHLGPLALNMTMQLWRGGVEHQPKSVIKQHVRVLFDVFADLFQVRAHIQHESNSGKFTDQNINSSEHVLIEAAMAMVLKTNDVTFQPFFLRLADSCTRKENNNMPAKFQENYHTKISLFNFTYALSEKLQSIVTMYFAHLIDTATEIFAQVPSANSFTANKKLLISTLHALSSGFKHDRDEFWSSITRFKSVSEALITLISHANAPSHPTSLAISTMCELAGAVSGNPVHLKTLNTALLGLMQPSRPAKVRLAAVNAQIDLTTGLGEDWMQNLPEMLPRVAELMEDGSEEVEKATARWVKATEECLGESLEGMIV